MAYPTVSAPYGFRPVGLIGGQVFAGSTRMVPIQYGYATNIFFGDWIAILRGQATRLAVTTGGGAAGLIGVFLGCNYTDPVMKQKRFSQYWPSGTLAGDAVAIIADDPDTTFRSTVVTTQGGTTIGSVCPALVGQNLTASDLAGNVNTGDSSNALFWTATTTTITYPMRLVGVVPDTSFGVTYTGSSSTTTVTITNTGGFTQILPIGTQVSYVAANGQLIDTSSYLSVATTVGGTTATINATVAVPGSVTAIPAASTIVFTQYPEALTKLNFGIHEYYTATAV